jgi:hypothetical protein
MARRSSVVAPTEPTKSADPVRKGPNTFVSVKVHAKAAEGVKMIAKTLASRAQDGSSTCPVELHCDQAHVWDIAVVRLAKELGVKL